MYLTTEVEV